MTDTVPEAVVGYNGIVFTLDPIVNGDPSGAPISYDGNLRQVQPVPTDKDSSDVTFLEVKAGDTTDFSLTLTMLVAHVAGSLWKLFWDNPAGQFACVYGPYGNAVATADKPHWSMTIKASGKPAGFTQQATKDTTRVYTEYTVKVIGVPELITS
jgi:hypothetical protein